MMGRALLMVGAFATLVLVATGVLGYMVVDSKTVDRHVVLGLAADPNADGGVYGSGWSGDLGGDGVLFHCNTLATCP